MTHTHYIKLHSCEMLLGHSQGLNWYKANLKQDRDGDIADEFLLERSDKSSKGPNEKLQVINH